MDLTDDDVLEILKLFEQSKFDFLHLEHGDRKITISKPGYGPPAGSAAVPAIPSQARAADAASKSGSEVAPKPIPTPIEAGLIPITSPIVGRFYAAPSPNDPPFVEIGSRVAVDATLGLIEVMKVFTSIKSTVAGTVEQILVTNGASVEYGQPLFFIRPEA